MLPYAIATCLDDVTDGRQALYTNILIDGCLFEDCYASRKGGGMHQGVGQTSVLGSVFYNSSAGSNNEKDGEVSLWRNVRLKCVPRW